MSLIYFCIVLVFIALLRYLIKRPHLLKIGMWPMTAAYCAFLIFITLVRPQGTERRILTEPFRALKATFGLNYSFWETLTRFVKGGWKAAKVTFHPNAYNNAFLNILLFIPLGCLFPAINKNKSILLDCFFGLLVSLSIETLQYFFRLGVFEVDDLWHNTLGTLAGAIIFTVFINREKNKVT